MIGPGRYASPDPVDGYQARRTNTVGEQILRNGRLTATRHNAPFPCRKKLHDHRTRPLYLKQE